MGGRKSHRRGGAEYFDILVHGRYALNTVVADALILRHGALEVARGPASSEIAVSGRSVDEGLGVA